MVSAAAGERSARWRHMGVGGVITILALALRLYGITWGLPNQDRVATYHPDEGVNLVGGVLDRGVARPHLDLGFYNYGTVYFYAWQAAAAMNSVYGGVRLSDGAGKPSPDSAASLILVGRLVTALAGAVTVGLLFVIGLRLYGPLAGAVAAACYAVYPLAAVHGHFATVDVMAALLCLCSVWAAQVAETKSTIGAFAVAGAVLGVAAATKYTSAAFAAAVVWAAIVTPGAASLAQRLKLGAVSLAAAAVGFLGACPGAWLNWPRFAADFAYEMSKSRQGMGLLFVDTGNGWVYHLVSSLRYGMGVPLLLLVLVAMVTAARRRSPADRLLLASAVPYYVVIGLAQVRFMRYVLPLLPILALLTGALVARAGCCRMTTLACRAGTALGWGYTCLVALALCGVMAGVDARDRAAAYIRAGGADRTVGFATTPWYWSPPLMPSFTLPGSYMGRRNAILADPGPWRIRLPARGCEWDPAVAEDPATQVVVVSNIESADALRLRRPEALGFLAILGGGYQERVFGTRPNVLGISLPEATGLPNDMLYILPSVSVWERRRGR